MKIDPSPRWKNIDDKPKGNNEILAPNFIQAKIKPARGTKHKAVNAVETTVAGLFSGSLNMCVISGLGLSHASLDGFSMAEKLPKFCILPTYSIAHNLNTYYNYILNDFIQ